MLAWTRRPVPVPPKQQNRIIQEQRMRKKHGQDLGKDNASAETFQVIRWGRASAATARLYTYQTRNIPEDI